MKKITIEAYTIDELEDKAKEVARDWYRQRDGYPFLFEDMEEKLKEKIKENGYEAEEIKLYYSLSYSQGDGASFEAVISKDGKTWHVKKDSSMYEHEYTMHVYNEEDDEDEEVTTEMRSIAGEIKKYGYRIIEDAQTDENVDENIRINEYLFTKEGSRTYIL